MYHLVEKLFGTITMLLIVQVIYENYSLSLSVFHKSIKLYTCRDLGTEHSEQ